VTEDPFGRAGEEQTDAFGRPLEKGHEAEQPRFAPPTDDAPEASAPPRFAPPTDAPPQPAAWTAPPVEQQAVGQAAEWIERVGAAVIDFFVRAGIVLAAIAIGAIAYAGGDTAGDAGIGFGFILGYLATYAYAPWMIAARNGQTVGHKAVNTRIVRTDGAPLSGGTAVLREVVVKGLLFDLILTSLTFGIAALLNYLWPLWDDRDETLHDKMCNTRVLKS
jgi:uncharacterized RDD family membrane protein YckC